MIQPASATSKNARDAWLRALQRTAAIERDPTPLPVLIERLALEHGSLPALASADASFSYRQLAARCHRYARWGLLQGLQMGDVISLVMANRAEFLAVWLGLTRIGVTVALTNSQLSGALLVHAIQSVQPRLIIVGAERATTLAAIRHELPAALTYWIYGRSTEDIQPIEPALEAVGAESVPADECAPPTLDGTALYIYTSGTTGLPKAAKVSHYRVLQWSQWFAGMMDARCEDRLYNCLPLYHSVGGVVACGSMLVAGGSVVIRDRFSAADFWRDVCEERCTVFQYIGELCRYLVNSPVNSYAGEHALRLACGNGLRPEVWDEFKTRFRIPRILEYYASTEGNFSLYNCEEEPGAIGRIPPMLGSRLKVALLRVDLDSELPVRNSAGLCERCDIDEIGEAVGSIPHAMQRLGRFEGYADTAASAAKLLRNVFTADDVWYRTGDLMRRDARGFYYFVDRMGDSYRWRGENVSTSEVASVLSTCPGVLQGVVYGVSVPGVEGRAGMAALVVGQDFDLAAFHAHTIKCLPQFARPKFLRVSSALDFTGTFKPKKQELVAEGYDPGLIKDLLYVDDPHTRAYVVLDREVHANLARGLIRL